jgi:hypothetical protein
VGLNCENHQGHETENQQERTTERQPEHRVEELRTPAFQGREGSQRAPPPPIPPRPRETAAQPAQRKLSYAKALQAKEDARPWKIIKSKVAAGQEKEKERNKEALVPAQDMPVEKQRMLLLRDQNILPL